MTQAIEDIRHPLPDDQQYEVWDIESGNMIADGDWPTVTDAIERIAGLRLTRPDDPSWEDTPTPEDSPTD